MTEDHRLIKSAKSARDGNVSEDSIPDDVMDQAEDYYESVLDRVAGDTEPMPVGGWRGEYIRTFARAILAEREACAKIAEEYTKPWRMNALYIRNIQDESLVKPCALAASIRRR